MHQGYTLAYNKQGELLFVTEQTWTLDEFGFCEDPQRVSITEFRGNGRARYMVRERDPAFALDVLPGTTRWSDYDGDEIYGDYVVDDETGAVTNTMAYLPGVGQMDILSREITYFHGDQIGSLRVVTDQQSVVSGVMVYTAFGEQVYADGTVGTRYQYAGAWGYESSVGSDVLAELGWLHVGHRYYDTSTGRFLQRDPIGIRGGMNVYAYAFNNPLRHVDPAGLTIWDDLIDIGGMLVGIGSCIAACSPAILAPGAPVYLWGGMVAGAGTAGRFGERHGINAWVYDNSLDGWVLLWEWWWEIGRYSRKPVRPDGFWSDPPPPRRGVL